MSQFFVSGDHKYWSFSFSISPSNEFSGMITFKMDRLGLLVVQGHLLAAQKSSPAQFKSIISLALSLLYSPALTSIHDYQKNYSFVYGPLSSKRYLCFIIHCLGLSSFPFKEQSSFNFMATVTICSDFGAQENKMCHCF